MDSEVRNDKDYLNRGLDSIKTASNAGLNISIATNKYSSTTKVPGREPVLLKQLLTAAKEIFTKLNDDLESIRTVGDGFKTMDDFLSEQSIDLGFQIQSFKISNVELSDFAAASLADLLNKQVPIIKGYNDKTETPKNTGKNTGGSYNGGSSTSSGDGDTGTPSPEPTTEDSTEMITEVETEPNTEEETIPQTEPVTEKETEAVTQPPTEAQTEKSTKPSTGGSKKKTKPSTTTATEPGTPPSIEEPSVDEPIVEEPIIEEPIIEEPIDDFVIEPEPVIEIEDEIIDLDSPTIEAQPKKSNAGKVIGTIAGVGVAAGAAAAGYAMYKKKKDDEEYSDYGYEDDGGDNQ